MCASCVISMAHQLQNWVEYLGGSYLVWFFFISWEKEKKSQFWADGKSIKKVILQILRYSTTISIFDGALIRSDHFYLNSIFSSISKRIRANSTIMNAWKIMVTYSHFVKDEQHMNNYTDPFVFKICLRWDICHIVVQSLGIDHIRFVESLKETFPKKLDSQHST
jgi:hypothetical protein